MERGNLYPNHLARNRCYRRGEKQGDGMKAIIIKNESGVSLIETVIALVLLGVFGATFLGALGTSSKARLIADEQASARILAESQMEYIREQDYAFDYEVPPPGEDYPGYSSIIDIDPMRNGNIEKITVTIMRHDKEITSLESYKVNR
jgi:type II secretory pathway pseudopilin PulG